MDEPPSTQHTQVLPVFLQEDGHALPVFVEACSIVNRPKLVRTLKKAGAEICTDPREARIILVDTRTYDGRRFIRDWGSDPNKVVLEYTWITKSCTAGRALMEGDEWGGCLTQDDGLALDADANMDDEGSQVELTNNPLPTPRVTPVETAITKAKVRRKSRASVDVFEPSASTSNFGSPTFTTPESLPFQAAEFSSAQSSVPVHGNDIQIPTTVPQYTPSLPSIQHHQMMQHQQNMHPGMQNTPAQLTNFMQQQNMLPGMMSQMTMPMQFWAQMMGTMLSQSTPQPNPDLFAMSLIDAMRSHGMVPYPQTQGGVPQQTTPDNSSAPQISQPSSTQSEITTSSSSRSSTPQVLPISRKWNESASGYPPQVARRSGPPPRSHSPVDSPALGPPPVKKRPVKKQKREEQSTVNCRQSLATSDPLHSLYSAKTPAPLSQNAPSQKIFVKDNGEPMTFFVQIDQPSRQNLVTLIKRNGGKIDSSQTSADYAVLYSQSKTFTDLLKSANDAGKTTVGAPFIHDSIQDGVLRDPAKYKLKMLKRARKRKAQYDSSSDVEELTAAEAEAASVIEQKRLSRNQWQRDWRKRPSEGESDIKAVIKQDVSLFSEQSRIPSPPPPPPTSDQFSLKGRTKYSDLEREYTLKYIKCLLDRDHLTSVQHMANRLYQKMPRHTLKSWTSYISGYAMKEEVEDIRKQATVAHRKSLKQKQEQIVKEEPLEIELDQVAADRSGQFDTDDIKKMNEEDDLNAIVSFFAYGGGDEKDEGAGQEELWQRLSSKESCKTANSWAEFYERHYNIIQERYTKLVDNADSQPAISEVEILPAS